MSLWHDLIKAYAGHSIKAPELIIATLSQWALESNFGKSVLAKEHLNFGGLKFRARVNQNRQLATPVDYTDHAGELDTYCSFSSLEDFFDGYWEFIANGPYIDWEKHAEDPSGYITYIKDIGYATDSEYVGKVLGLMPRIRQQVRELGYSELLDDTSSAELSRVAILIGHNSVSKGAYSEAMQVSEWTYNKRVYNNMVELAGEYGVELGQFFRQKNPNGYSAEIAEAYSIIDAWQPEVILELHFNAGGGSGPEMLYWHKSKKGEILAREVQNAVIEALGLPSRGSCRENQASGVLPR